MADAGADMYTFHLEATSGCGLFVTCVCVVCTCKCA